MWKKLTTSLPDCSHDMNCSIMHNSENQPQGNGDKLTLELKIVCVCVSLSRVQLFAIPWTVGQGIRKIPWRKWLPTPVFLPGESHGQN